MIAVAKFKSCLKLTFYIFSTFTLKTTAFINLPERVFEYNLLSWSWLCSGICWYISYSFWAKVFRFYIENWPTKTQTHYLVLTGHTLQPLSYLGERRKVLIGLQNQLTMKFRSSLSDWSSPVWITLPSNFLYFFYFHPRSELISSYSFQQSHLSIIIAVISNEAITITI